MTNDQHGRGSDKLHDTLEDLAEHLRHPHHDEQARERATEAAKRAGENPRREGKKIQHVAERPAPPDPSPGPTRPSPDPPPDPPVPDPDVDPEVA
jgi:hypothetical protein